MKRFETALLSVILLVNFSCERGTLKQISQSTFRGNGPERKTRATPNLIGVPSQQFMESHERAKPISESYWVFTFAVALIAIGMEVMISGKTKVIQRKIAMLSRRNKVVVRQNEALRDALETLQHKREVNSSSFQTIAHDLRSPIAAIVSLSGFIIDENKFSAEDMELIRFIHTSATDSLNFIQEILDQNKADLETQTEDLYQLLSYCVAQLRFKAEEKHQRIILEGQTCNLKFNRAKIWRVFTNLISNAIKFSPPKTLIAVDLKLLAKKVVISIKDSGIGIPENIGEKIFTLGSKASRLGTSGEQSYGMGLGIVKQNIEAHGGRVTFKSSEGSGTTFFVELPIDEE